MLVLWSENPRNIKQDKKALGTHELDQEKKSPSSQSHQVQQLSMPWDQQPLAYSLLYL